MSKGWRYIATRLNGNGTETFLDYEVPLRGAELFDVVSGPAAISGVIRNGYSIAPMIPWQTAIYAEKDGIIREGAIVVDREETGPEMSLTCVGFSGYASGMPYGSEYNGIAKDPLEIVRHIWNHIQAARDGNIGLQLDDTKTPIRIGTPAKDVKFENSKGDDVEFVAGPYKMNYWSTFDLGKKIDDLALDTPFDYKVVHSWGEGVDKDKIIHKLVLGYPFIGRRHDNLRFAAGENIRVHPDITFAGGAYASEVIVLGAGEGREMRRGIAHRDTGRLRRPIVLEDKAITSNKAATSAAEQDISWRMGEADIEEIVVVDSELASIGSYAAGDEIKVFTEGAYSPRSALWYRVLSITTNVETRESTLSIARTDKVSK